MFLDEDFMLTTRDGIKVWVRHVTEGVVRIDSDVITRKNGEMGMIGGDVAYGKVLDQEKVLNKINRTIELVRQAKSSL